MEGRTRKLARTLAWRRRKAELRPAQRVAQGVDPEVDFGRFRAQAFELAFVVGGRGSRSPTREELAAPGDDARVGQRLTAHSREQRVGVAVGRIPLPGQQRLFDRVAAEPKMVMTEGALRQQGFAGRYRGFLRLVVLFQQGQEAEKNRPDESGARLFGRRQSLSHERQGLLPPPFDQRQFGGMTARIAAS